MVPKAAKNENPHAGEQIFAAALQYIAAGQIEEAERLCRQILAAEPAHADSLHLLGVIAHQAGRTNAALELIERALAIRDDSAPYHNDCGNVLRRLGRLDEALGHYGRALVLAPDYAEAHNNLGIALKEQSALDLAAARFREAVRLKPDYAIAHYNLGNVLQEQDALEESIAAYRRALALQPSYAKAEMNLGNALWRLGRFDDAAACYRRATAINPEYAEAHANEALALLLAGDFANGWRKYEWRWRLPHMKMRDFTAPLWDGGDLAGKTILLWSEQGLGDSIQFIRYATLVKQRGARVLLSCPSSLVRLFEKLDGIDQIFAEGTALPAFDYHAPLLSLPRMFGTRFETIPAEIPYINPLQEDVAKWAARLPRGFKVGLVWAGSARPDQPNADAIDRRRSLHLDQLAPLAEIGGVQFVSLQKGPAALQAKNPPPGLLLTDLMDEVGDFADTAALIANLDLVIGADTSVVHLAGAMGKPVWVLSRFDGCWRWLLNREDSPWYPSLRLFRQPQAGDWASVIGRVAAELQGAVSPD